ncbi:TPA: hypothetical protein I7730_16225 [Vibrio vulnificus]|uniref:Uncharacterized protein n=1 Tax=Vibrio vulnificus TaxID=672 RepID=A0A8H9TGD0_VIBVL|nr:hypothetical protein [Vibrio vulnificus]HAS8541331.1 hypothetical protein [Vibrio vulnificus]
MRTESQQVVYGLAVNLITKHTEVSEKLGEINNRLCNRQNETPESVAELQKDKELLTTTKDHLWAIIKLGEEMESARLREEFKKSQS